MSKTEDQEASGTSWTRQLADAHENTLIHLSELETKKIDPKTIRGDMPAQRYLHAAVLNYYDLLRPFRAEVNEKLWAKRVYVVTGTEMGDLEIRLDSPPNSDELYSLSSNWRMRYESKRQIEESHMFGEEQRTEDVRVFLPPIACREVYDWLNDVLHDLGFTAKVAGSKDRFHIKRDSEDHPEPVNENVKKPSPQD